MRFDDYKIKGFLEDLGSDSPSPGGGSTAALVGALAGCLNKMVYSLTIGKKSFEALSEDKKNEMLDLEEKTKEFITKSMELMEGDRKAFNELMESYKIPKEDSDRNKKINQKTIGAMNAPLEMARVGVEFYKNIKFSVNYGNKMLVSDGGVSAILLYASIESSILNVKVNLKFINDVELKNNVEKEIEEIAKESLKEKNEIMKMVEEKIK